MSEVKNVILLSYEDYYNLKDTSYFCIRPKKRVFKLTMQPSIYTKTGSGHVFYRGMYVKTVKVEYKKTSE